MSQSLDVVCRDLERLLDPILEIGKILATRGHRIEFATLEGQQTFADSYNFISQVHIVGPGVLPEDEERQYLKMSAWENLRGYGPILEIKQFLDSTWPHVYRNLKAIMRSSSSRPDMILADYLVEAALDEGAEWGVLVAQHWPQMLTMMLAASYITGYAGLQVEVLTSEHATIWQRLKNELVLLRIAPVAIKYKRWLQNMWRSEGVSGTFQMRNKPEHLVLVNSFFGVEVAKDIPPNVAAIGPVLADEYDPLSADLQAFLSTHERVLYIFLGTHVLLCNEALRKMLEGAIDAHQRGLIDGVVWAIRGMARRQFDTDMSSPGRLDKPMSIAALMDNSHPDYHFIDFAPRRAVLDHSSVKVFLTQ